MMLTNGANVQLFGVEDYADSSLVNGYITVRTLLTPFIIGGAAYHGYKRNDSIAWAAGWAILAGLFPMVTTGVAVAQGYGKPG